MESLKSLLDAQNEDSDNQNLLGAKQGHKLSKALQDRKNSSLNRDIAKMYNESTALWEAIWGEHLHHGYYPDGKYMSNHFQAQIDMIDRVVEWAAIQTIPSEILDVGCGVGGTSRHLGSLYNCNVLGITLDKYQRNQAEARSKANASNIIQFQVVDALNLPYKDNSFDLVISLESAEHIPDRLTLIQNFKRVLRPGGQLIIVTWCHRELCNEERQLSTSEQRLLNQLCSMYHLPEWWSASNYLLAFKHHEFDNIRVADWTKEVQQFWPAVWRSVFSWKAFLGFLKAKKLLLKQLWAIRVMIRGYKQGLIKYMLFTGVKSNPKSYPVVNIS